MNVIYKDQMLTRVSKNVNQRLKALGWSMRELSRQSDVSPMTLSYLLRASRLPEADALARIAESFNCTMDDLLAK